MANVDLCVIKKSLSRFIAVAVIAGSAISVAPMAARAQNAQSAMASDPDLSKWSYLVQVAGLSTAAATNTVTVFALTNEGFDKINAVWRGALQSPGSSGSPNFQKTQRVLRSQAVLGLHPPSEFAGKVVTLTSVAGTPITVDGTDQGKLTIKMQYATGTLSGTPIITSQTVIYPIVVSDVHQ